MNDLYNPFITDTAATFETLPIDLAARKAWLRERAMSPRWPVFVAEDQEGAIAGFANASSFDPRPAYETSVKVSVFVGGKGQGRGIGAALYATLFDALEKVDVHRAYALIVAPNEPSARLHERFGFRHVSTLDEVGRKFGRYYSVMWFEKRF